MATIREKIRTLSQSRLVSIDDQVKVVATERISPSFQRVALRGACLSAYDTVRPADGFKIELGTPEAFAIRGFTVRRFDPAELTLHADVHLHPHSPSAAWAQDPDLDRPLRFLGFRRDFAIGDGVEQHVLVADASAIPAVATILEAIPSDHRVVVVAEAPAEQDLALLGAGRHVEVRPVVGAPSVGVDSPLATAARDLATGPEAQYWVSAESSTVRAIRRHLLDGGVPRGHLHATAYWIAGTTSTQRDAREAVAYTRAVEAGLDVDDPQVYDLLEFDGDAAAGAPDAARSAAGDRART
ncbi:siderophore-interacting protein [Aeromicrobium sp. Sec7.5]|uniref:siderophore-interacting protein n=1 Tax=Aeromicrobium sp. Sec7.5 TaxID=3121276 RepID=UPI002FE4D479